MRVNLGVAFAMPDGRPTPTWTASLDPGAPFSLLPRQLWELCAGSVRGQTTIRGIVRSPEGELPVQVGDVTCLLTAETGDRLALPILSYLAYTDEVPVLLGYQGILTEFGLRIDAEQGAGFLEVVRGS
ncbi:MAG: hypothetical protein COZ06_11735 [Armatimonadetes bacterium CG_4_10_14_3_um_filter_66_18]|nr:hypothetical protein [Armatimonadota bacterium]OIP11159.1 MAG: hypothetical protein AUJ96_02870 [Armatimonadetes bacterium CG2_30_66_41]PIU91193.1 MAG: hypothetical protein COS65_22805 [Armatimonadetes bacterium CG06_land_8_20_14_3_00_66_21]PIW16792.1 MAG: hypothetical protein COW34_05630 [Armatimonadetes bacterium CG17_big_fil_post_rev_8_21_14_2_50_66_6]PIX48000.1 MAG: hypothetical protein COZ57_06920 [Armatimonadetes bacterium CG_4_8_14_3_um_filter_66_20]PIY49977.1 MAG: hypothetical prote